MSRNVNLVYPVRNSFWRLVRFVCFGFVLQQCQNSLWVSGERGCGAQAPRYQKLGHQAFHCLPEVIGIRALLRQMSTIKSPSPNFQHQVSTTKLSPSFISIKLSPPSFHNQNMFVFSPSQLLPSMFITINSSPSRFCFQYQIDLEVKTSARRREDAEKNYVNILAIISGARLARKKNQQWDSCFPRIFHLLWGGGFWLWSHDNLATKRELRRRPKMRTLCSHVHLTGLSVYIHIFIYIYSHM